MNMKSLDYILSPKCIRDGAQKIFDETVKGNTHFRYHPEKLTSTVETVMEVTRKNYPDLKIPFHSRWGHLRAGKVNRLAQIDDNLEHEAFIERVRIMWDLIIPSVLLDAGSGKDWKYNEASTGMTFDRSEGLGVASFHLFKSGAFAADGKSWRADASALKNVTPGMIAEAFQVSETNPLVGVEGRAQLLRNLGSACENKKYFKDGRPGNLIDYIVEKFGRLQPIPAEGILRAVLDALGPIWPGREKLDGVNLGDVWRHSKYDLIAFHKLSQWMTYSLVEPMDITGMSVAGTENLTGLAEYRNGGLMIDSGLISFANPEDGKKNWEPSSDLIIEWRALTVYLLDRIGEMVQQNLGRTPQQFPLAMVLEGGTWWAGRRLASELRPGGVPPLNIISDGTVF